MKLLAVLMLALPAAIVPAAPTQVTIVFTDRAGTPAGDAHALLVNVDTADYLWVESAGGTATVDASPGHYAMFAQVRTGTDQASMLVQPRLDVTGDSTLTVDARVARPIDVRVPHRSARMAGAVIDAELRYTFDGEVRVVGDTLTSLDAARLSTAQLGKGDAALSSSIQVTMAEPDVRTSPYLYALHWERDGGMFTGLREHLRDRRGLSEVRADYASLAGYTAASTGAETNNDPSIGIPITLPRTRTEYYTEGTEWTARLCYRPADGTEPATCLGGAPGGRWNYGPFLPGTAFIERQEDRLRMLPSIKDQAGHRGLALSDIRDGRVTLYRDGVEVGTQPVEEMVAFGELPPEPARYRLEFTGALATLLPDSTFAAAWTFTSAYAVMGEGMLPAMHVRFTPAGGHPVAGRPLTLPVTVDGGTPRALAVQVSYDAGATWLPTRVHDGTVTVTPPSTASDVSLRAQATDTAGNTVEQTITRAIPLG